MGFAETRTADGRRTDGGRAASLTTAVQAARSGRCKRYLTRNCGGSPWQQIAASISCRKKSEYFYADGEESPNQPGCFRQSFELPT